MKSLLWFGIIGALVGVGGLPAEARMAVESSASKSVNTDLQAHQSGVIGQIDLGSGTMEIGGVKYLYAPSMAHVYRKRGKSVLETVSPLSLRSDARIEFLTKKEGAKERITDIWLTGEK